MSSVKHRIFVGRDMLPLEELKEHETINHTRLSELMDEIVSTGMLDKPIVVDINTKTIIDGHHRYNVFRNLGFGEIPVIYVDYLHPSIVVNSRRQVTKEDVIRTASAGKKFPSKTTKHMLAKGHKLVHISDPVKNVNYPVLMGQMVE